MAGVGRGLGRRPGAGTPGDQSDRRSTSMDLHGDSVWSTCLRKSCVFWVCHGEHSVARPWHTSYKCLVMKGAPSPPFLRALQVLAWESIFLEHLRRAFSKYKVPSACQARAERVLAMSPIVGAVLSCGGPGGWLLEQRGWRDLPGSAWIYGHHKFGSLFLRQLVCHGRISWTTTKL